MSIFQLLLPYLVLCGGILLEGESFLIAAAISAHYGIMNIYIIIVLTVICTQISDWFWFLTGRKKGAILIQKRPGLHKRIEFFYSFIDRYPYQVMLLYRFIYGFRSVMPLVLGTSRVRAKHFLIFGLSSTIIWSIAFACLGYNFGTYIQANTLVLKKYQYYILLAIFIVGIIILLRYINRNNRRNIHENSPNLKVRLALQLRIAALRASVFARER